ncbi:MAG: PAS domain S-box protein, partial [Candidatus Omnitrophica bacterium]|nr:PAS domain S-box protein [Candidatus Omnitrophota bacterium]
LRVYTRLVEFTGDGIYSYTYKEGALLYANQGFVQILGLDCAPEELKGKFLKDLLIYLEKPGTIREAANAKGEIHDYEYHFKTLKGEDRWVIHSSFLVRDPVTGEKIVEAIVKDITARKLADERLKRVNRTLGAITRCSQAMMHVTQETALLNEICQIIVEDCGYPLVWAGFLDESSRHTLIPVSSAGFENREFLMKPIAFADERQERCPCGSAVRSARTMICRDFSAMPAHLPWYEEIRKQGCRSLGVFPLVDQDHVFGVLNIYSRNQGGFDEDEIRLLEELTADLAFGVRTIRAEEERKHSEKALRESEKRYRGIVEDQAELLTRWRPDGNLTFVNEACARYFDLKPEELVGRNFFDMIPEIEREKLKHLISFLTPDKSVEAHEQYYMHPDGTIRWQQWTNRALFNEQGQIVEFQSVGHDITELKQAEEKLMLERDKIQKYLDVAGVIMIALDTDGSLKLVNNKACEITGFPHDELIGRNWFDGFIPEGLRDEVRVVFKKLMAGEITNLEYFENSIVTRSGEERLIRWHNVILEGETGEALGILSSGEDVTERKISENALRESEENFRALAENANDGILITADEGKLVYANKRAAGMTDYMADELPGMDIKKLIHPDEQEKLMKNYEKRIKGENIPMTYETILRKRDGRDMPVEVTGARTVWKGKNAGIVIFRDITERRKVDEFKNEIVRTVSHELRTPLSITKESINLVLDGSSGQVTEEQKVFLETARRNIIRLSRMIDELLDISRLEVGRIELEKENVDLTLLIQSVAFTFEQRLKEKGLDLRLDIPPEGVNAYVDADRMTQIFTNLLSNAIKFTEKGAIAISIKERENEIECSVSDSGIGIPQEALAKIFEKFQKVRRTSGPGEKGTGLGLSITKGLVELHQGRIWVKSKLGEGANFVFTIPKKSSANAN